MEEVYIVIPEARKARVRGDGITTEDFIVRCGAGFTWGRVIFKTRYFLKVLTGKVVTVEWAHVSDETRIWSLARSLCYVSGAFGTVSEPCPTRPAQLHRGQFSDFHIGGLCAQAPTHIPFPSPSASIRAHELRLRLEHDPRYLRNLNRFRGAQLRSILGEARKAI